MKAASIAAAVALALLLAPLATRGEAVSRAGRARNHAEAGQQAFTAGRYEEAIREFRAAYEMVPEPMLSYNMAVSFERLGQRRDAIEHYQRYLREEPDARNADEVQRRVTRLHREEAAEQDRPVEVRAADEQRLVDRVPHQALETARHDMALLVGTSVALTGIRTAGSASFGLLLEYHYRIDPSWHIGLGFLADWYGKHGSGDQQAHYGFVGGGRWGFRPIPAIEVRFEAQIGYQYVDLGRQVGYESAHYMFLRVGPTLAWDAYRGFGLRLSVDGRIGYVDWSGPDVPDRLGGSLDVFVGIFWAV